MLIAVTSEDARGLDGAVSAHFGRCPYITMVELEGQRIARHWVEENPNAHLHQPGTLPMMIRALGVTVVLAGGMGPRALEMLAQHGIEVATGARGTVRETVEAYLSGTLSGTDPCEDQEEHGCGGHHA